MMGSVDAQIIGARLRELRGGRSQQEIADACGVSKMAVSQYEAGIRVPSDNVKTRLARVYQATVEAIFFTP